MDWYAVAIVVALLLIAFELGDIAVQVRAIRFYAEREHKRKEKADGERT